MKLVRYGNPGKEKPGLIDANGQLRDLSSVVKDIGPDQLGDAALAKIAKVKTDKLPLDTDGRVPPAMIFAFRPRD